MPSPTQVPDDERYKVRNPGDDDYNRKFKEGNFEQRIGSTPSQDDVEKGLRDAENNANNPNRDADGSLRDQEDSSAADSPWGNSYTGANQRTKSKAKFKLTWTKGLIGGGAATGIAALIIFITTLAPAALLANLASNATINLDTRTSILDKRVLKVLDAKLNGSEVTNGSCSVIKVACRFSRPSNALLTTLDEVGIKPVNGDGVAIEKTRTGFPNQKPVRYEFTKADGSVLSVQSTDFVSTLRSDPEFRKAFTRGYNARYLAYTTVKVRTAFFKKYGVDRTGKASKEVATAKTPQEAVKNTVSNADSENPVRGAASEEAKRAAAREVLTEEMTNEVGKAARKGLKAGGSPTLTLGTVVCLAMNAPGTIGNIVRLYQMRQLIVLASTIVLTPESMARAGDMDPALMASIGGLLTATTINSNGTRSKSAMDSLGVRNVLFGDTNKGNSPNYFNFVPGGAINKQFSQVNQLANNPAIRDTCNAIYSPQAQVTAAAIDGALSAATGGVGGIVTGLFRGATTAILAIIAIDTLVSETMKLAQPMIGEMLKVVSDEAIAGALGNPSIENASNEDFGEAIGAGLAYTFSQTGLTTGSGVLRTDQLSGVSSAQTESALAYAEQDRFGRSPLDISSPYTFMGSIVSNYARHSYVAGNAFSTTVTAIGNTLSQPFGLLSKKTYAATDNAAARYAFAADHGVDPSIGVGLYGELASGIPSQYMEVSTQAVVNDVASQIDENTGLPKDDSDMATIMSECSSGSLLSAAGCTITDQSRANSSIYQYDAEINNVMDNTEAVYEGGEADTGGGAVNTGRPPEAVDKQKGWTIGAHTGVDVSNYACDPRTPVFMEKFTSPRYKYSMKLCMVPFNTNTNDNGNGSKAVNALISTNLVNMFEAARADGVEIGVADAMRLDGGSNLYYSEHATGLAVDIKGASTNTICFNNNSRSGYDTKEAAEAGCRSVGGKEYEAYTWLNNNAARFGFFNFDPEPWHWSTSGA